MEIAGVLVIIATAIAFSGIGIWYTSTRRFSIEDYITSRNTYSAVTTGLTIIATAMGAWILLSPAETGATVGIMALVGYGIGSASAVLVFVIVGKRIRALMPHGHSLTEYVLHRYGKGMYLAVLALSVMYMGVFLTAEMTGIALAMQMVFGTPLIVTAAIVGVATLAYTAAGGLKASVFTDVVQAWVILPLLALVFLASLLFVGGLESIFAKAQVVSPALFSLTGWEGIAYALSLIIAIIGAELFNQANWQRVYAAKDTKTMQRGFSIASIIIFPIIIIAGLFGLFAVGTGTAEHPSVALFTFLMQVTPQWVLITAMVLAIALVMSSMDSLLNGLVSLFTVDLVRLRPSTSQKKMLSVARSFMVILSGIAILLATQGYSVLYLFLVADLLCVAAVFPAFYGMFARRLSDAYAVIATGAGVLLGGLLFPTPSYSQSLLSVLSSSAIPSESLIGSGSLLLSFAVAAMVPLVLCLILSPLSGKFDFSELKKDVVDLGR